MIAMFSAFFGFMAPFLPELLKYFTRKQDNSHELELMKLRLESAASEHTWRMEEINAKADIEESIAVRKPEETYADKLLGAAKGSGIGVWMTSFIALVGVIIDAAIRLARPAITYAVVGFYITYKLTMFHVFENGTGGAEAILKTWGEFDEQLLIIVVSYWFGHRALNKWKR
ncbi:hypothetical protein [Pseudomonas fluorescens]|uniref:Uncharacterized protein n=1 Tax=Pseudomonas fluorescens TaxID=294 RepID=A0A0F4VGV1_PSEFL|nr:hypothetical protein [Pseudomonas fluorescens]KJZ67252.1 hypothetical protein VD17_03045 [Pseudomonas fluorescens]